LISRPKPMLWRPWLPTTFEQMLAPPLVFGIVGASPLVRPVKSRTNYPVDHQ
jgi:hypothetical protein